MKRFFGLFAMISLVAWLGACGGGGDGGPDAGGSSNPGFIVPDETTVAYVEEGGSWVEQGAADWSCLNTPTDDVVPATAITVSGTTGDFQSGDPVGNVDIELYEGSAITGSPIETATSDASGAYSIEIPAGSGPRFAYGMFDPEESRFLDTFLMNQTYDPDDAEQSTALNSVSFLTASALPAFIGVERTEGLGTLAGAIRDCQVREVGGAIATVSSVSCAGDDACSPAHLEGAQTYYFSAGSTSLPVRLSQQATTNDDGLFVVLELPPTGEAYLQVWGFPTQADLDAGELVLLGEIEAPVLADSVIQGSIDPLRTE